VDSGALKRGEGGEEKGGPKVVRVTQIATGVSEQGWEEKKKGPHPAHGREKKLQGRINIVSIRRGQRVDLSIFRADFARE